MRQTLPPTRHLHRNPQSLERCGARLGPGRRLRWFRLSKLPARLWLAVALRRAEVFARAALVARRGTASGWRARRKTDRRTGALLFRKRLQTKTWWRATPRLPRSPKAGS